MISEKMIELYGGEGDAETVLFRFGNNASILEKFLGKFLEDKTYDKLLEAVDKKNPGDVEVWAHTLKGLAANLGLDELSKRSAWIVDAVRKGAPEESEELMPAVTEEYERVISILKA